MTLQRVTEELGAGISRLIVLMNVDERPLAFGGGARPDGPVRMTVPIRRRDRDIASFRVQDSSPGRITSTEYALLDAASAMVRDLLDDGAARAEGGRESVQRLLLDDDEAVRRHAFVVAEHNRWIDRSAPLVVRAVLADAAANSVQRLALARHIGAGAGAGARVGAGAGAGGGAGSALFAGERNGLLYFVTRGRSADPAFDQRLAALAADFGFALVATGAAILDPADEELGIAARQARVAAELTAALPELRPTGWYDELGPWVLLSQIAPGSVRLAEISPAAETLVRPGNELCRETVEVYLDAGARNSVACQRLHVHRTTLYYRLDNAPEVVREALQNGVTPSSLHLALKLERLWRLRAAA